MSLQMQKKTGIYLFIVKYFLVMATKSDVNGQKEKGVFLATLNWQVNNFKGFYDLKNGLDYIK